MKKNLIARTSMGFATTPSKVWKALTDPEIIKQYLMGTNVTTDWKVGSPINYKGEYNGKAYHDKGIIKQFEPGKILQTTFWSSQSGTEDKPENYANVSYRISARNGKTALTISQDNIKNEKGVAQSKENWKNVLKTMKGILEKK